jgi:hypothetical protein
MVNVNGGHISDINIYSSSGIKVIKGMSFSGVSASHNQNCTAGYHQTEKGKSRFGVPFFFDKRIWLLKAKPYQPPLFRMRGCGHRHAMTSEDVHHLRTVGWTAGGGTHYFGSFAKIRDI